MSRRIACPLLLLVVLAGPLAAGFPAGAAEANARDDASGQDVVAQDLDVVSQDVAAQPSPGQKPRIAALRVGFDGRYKAGVWTPVEVTLRGGAEPISGQLSLIVPDGDGVPSRVGTSPDKPVELPAGGVIRVSLLARFGRVESTMRVELRDRDGRVLAMREVVAADRPDRSDPPDLLPAVGAGRNMLVTVGGRASTDRADATERVRDPLGVERAVAIQRLPNERRAVVAHVADARELPAHWIGYEGIDAMVLSTSRPEVYGDLPPNDPRVEAIDHWVRMGGTLVLCVGVNAAEFAGPDGRLVALARFLPGRFEADGNDEARGARLYSLRQTGGLETYCEAAVPVPAGSSEQVIEVAKLIDLSPDGAVDAREADLPLVVRAPRGFGRVVYFAGDLDRPPLAAWADRPRLVAKLLGLAPGAESDVGAQRGAVMHHGFDDVSGQLRGALDRFDQVDFVPFWVVVALVVVYLLLIGPGDYFLLRKVVGRMEWTWLTFPLIVALFGAGAYWAAHRLKGDRIRVNQVDLVDVVVDDACDESIAGNEVDDENAPRPAGLVRGTSWMNVYSPRSAAYDLMYTPRLPDGVEAPGATVSLAWQGLPGRFLGGMDPRASSPQPPTVAYDFSPGRDAMRGVPIQVGATKSLAARWTARIDALPFAELHDEGHVPLGTITNRLDFPLCECFLVYRGQAYTLATDDNRSEPSRLGTLKPGESTTLDYWTWRTELRTLLTGRRLVKDDQTDQNVVTPYDPASVDPSYILRIMMFFEAAGGHSYTELGNGHQGFVDLTRLLDDDRAILVARGPNASDRPGQGATLSVVDPGDPTAVASEDAHRTFYRFVFRVKQGTAP